jgi:6-phosphogluconolactonase
LGLSVGAGKRGPFALRLSGGSTPRQLYAALAAAGARHGFPWGEAHWFWGDERFVPHDHIDSNFRTAHEAMFSRVAVPAANIHPIPTVGLSAREAASAYEATLRHFYGGEQLNSWRPLFDPRSWVLARTGTLPRCSQTNALSTSAGAGCWTCESDGRSAHHLDLPPLESSREILFLATGVRKQRVLARVWSGDRSLPRRGCTPAAACTGFSIARPIPPKV